VTVLDDIKRDYPELWWLFKDPQVGPLLRDAVTPGKEFSPTLFQAKFYQTPYFKRRSVSQRQWEIVQHTDPGEAKKQSQLQAQGIAAQASRLGFKLTRAELNTITQRSLALGLGADDFWVTMTLNTLAQKRPGRTTAGAWNTTAMQVRNTSQQDYLKPLPQHVANKWTQWIVTGQKTLDDFKAASQMEAMKRYPHMADELQRGYTPGDVISPFRDIISNELELGGGQNVNINDPRWRKITGFKDTATNKVRLPTESEVMVMARQDPRFWKTQNGRTMESDMASTILNVMGKRKSGS